MTTSSNLEYSYSTPGATNQSVQPALDRLYCRIITQLGRNLSICDLGCGNGRLALKLANQGYRVTGVDNSSSGIEIARCQAVGTNATFVQGSIDSDLSQRLGTKSPFDVAVSSDVIEHLYRPRDLIIAANEVLRPGGHIVIGTPYHGYWKNLALSITNKWDAHHTVEWDGGHIKFFSVKTLTRMVTSCGFQVERIHYFGRAPWLWKNMICVAIRKKP